MRLLLSALLSLLSFWGQDREAALDMDLLSTLELFERPCAEMEVPEPLAKAIAMVESGMKPWAVNVEGESFGFETKGEALAKAQEALAEGRSFDVGLMQVNGWWLKKYRIPLEAALDPLANVYLGVWVLRQELDRHRGDVQAAVGAYHSPRPAKAGRYAAAVKDVLENGSDEVGRRGARLVPIDDAPEPSLGLPARRVSRAIATPAMEARRVPSPLLVMSAKVATAQRAGLRVSATGEPSSMKVGPRGQEK